MLFVNYLSKFVNFTEIENFMNIEYLTKFEDFININGLALKIKFR